MNDDPTTDSSFDDVVTTIRQQHETIRALFSEISSCPPLEREQAFEPLVRLLAVHETAEEEVVYPHLRSQGDTGAAIADARTAEEDAAKKALADLESMEAASAHFKTALDAFQVDVETHAAREEAEVLPLLAQSDHDRRRKMAKAFAAAESMAPTHAHRMAPESALGNMLVGPFVAMVDRVRDAIRDASRDDR